MYVCGPTVYQRAHIGNAVPVRHLLVAPDAGCASAATTSRYVHNITDVNDKIYDAAPGQSAARAERRRSGTSRTPLVRARDARTCIRPPTRRSPRSSRSSRS